MTFKDENLPMQHLVRELEVIRAHNKAFEDGRPQDTLLMFGEAGLVCMTFEHFIRIVLGPKATERDTLYALLDKAIFVENLIRLPGLDQEASIAQVCNVRNTLLHGNYAQAARQAKCSSVAEYFQKEFAPELEHMYKLGNFVAEQIDHETGKPLKAYPPITHKPKPGTP